jgi:hypothetical protein
MNWRAAWARLFGERRARPADSVSVTDGAPVQPMVRWPIVRTAPEHQRGFAIPAFIHNRDWFLVTVDAYADGTIDAWGLLDRALFREKLKTGWVAARPPKGAMVSVFELGRARVDGAEWSSSSEAIQSAVEAAITTLNPEGRDLVDMHGSDVELRGKVRYRKMGKGTPFALRVAVDGSEIRGKRSWVLRSGDELTVVPWFCFQDGTSRFGWDGEAEPVEIACDRLRSGEYVLSVTDGAWVRLPGLGRMRVRDPSFGVEPEERIKEARDVIKSLNNEATSQDLCHEAFAAYKQQPSESNRDALRAAYEAVPKHHRMYLGTMDSKDHEIRRVLFPDEYKGPTRSI